MCERIIEPMDNAGAREKSRRERWKKEFGTDKSEGCKCIYAHHVVYSLSIFARGMRGRWSPQSG